MTREDGPDGERDRGDHENRGRSVAFRNHLAFETRPAHASDRSGWWAPAEEDPARGAEHRPRAQRGYRHEERSEPPYPETGRGPTDRTQAPAILDRGKAHPREHRRRERTPEKGGTGPAALRAPPSPAVKPLTQDPAAREHGVLA